MDPVEFHTTQRMVQDRYFYEPIATKYTVDRYLDDLEKRYRGIGAVLIWPTYPNRGIDNRNQHDRIRSMPGGVAGVKPMIADFHPRGVRVLFPMTMWDQGTGDPGMPWPEAIAGRMAEIGADNTQGTDGRLYPWGNGWDDSAAPVPDKSRTLRGPDLVGGHPKGAGPLGVMDMVGNVGQRREEFVDEHTRGGILRGGSYYQLQGSIWYFLRPTN